MTASARQSPASRTRHRHEWRQWASTATRLVILLSAVGAIVLTTATAAPPARTSAAQRYAGTWYEVARVPDQMQATCAGDGTATYRPMRDGSIEVRNRCLAGDSARDVAVGRAVPADARHGASAWVVRLDASDRYSVVSDAGHTFLWLLSRTPNVDAQGLDELVATLRAEGYPVDSLVPTQSLGRSIPRTPLII